MSIAAIRFSTLVFLPVQQLIVEGTNQSSFSFFCYSFLLQEKMACELTEDQE